MPSTPDAPAATKLRQECTRLHSPLYYAARDGDDNKLADTLRRLHALHQKAIQKGFPKGSLNPQPKKRSTP